MNRNVVGVAGCNTSSSNHMVINPHFSSGQPTHLLLRMVMIMIKFILMFIVSHDTPQLHNLMELLGGVKEGFSSNKSYNPITHN